MKTCSLAGSAPKLVYNYRRSHNWKRVTFLVFDKCDKLKLVVALFVFNTYFLKERF